MIHVRVDQELKTKASPTLSKGGVGMCDAVRLLLPRIQPDHRPPFDPKVPLPGLDVTPFLPAPPAKPRFCAILISKGIHMPQELYFEDFYVGQKFKSAGSARVTAEEIKEFGQKYDPQPFHLDEAAGEGSFFKGLAASGWLTAAIVMRLRVQSIRVFGGMIGAGVEEMRWTEPVRPGDAIRSEIEVLGVRHSQTRPTFGIVRTRSVAFNQNDKVVLRSTVNFLAPLKTPAK
jgi:acyl dehydratase